MSDRALFAIVGFGTYLFRASAMLRPSSGEPSPLLTAIPAAVLAAIVADQLLVGDRELDIRPSWLVAAVCAATVARWKGSAALTMGVGLVAVWALDAIF